MSNQKVKKAHEAQFGAPAVAVAVTRDEERGKASDFALALANGAIRLMNIDLITVAEHKIELKLGEQITALDLNYATLSVGTTKRAFSKVMFELGGKYREDKTMPTPEPVKRIYSTYDGCTKVLVGEELFDLDRESLDPLSKGFCDYRHGAAEWFFYSPTTENPAQEKVIIGAIADQCWKVRAFAIECTQHTQDGESLYVVDSRNKVWKLSLWHGCELVYDLSGVGVPIADLAANGGHLLVVFENGWTLDSRDIGDGRIEDAVCRIERPRPLVAAYLKGFIAVHNQENGKVRVEVL